jgi:anti-sigma-K factor RskA
MNVDVHALAGAFALDALPSDEAEEFRRHLAECAACQVEVAELQDTATHLGLATAEQPPPRVREAVLRTVHQTRQVPPPVQPAESRRWIRRTWLAAAAAVVVVGAGAVGVVDLVRDNPGQQDPIAAVVAAPDAETTAARLRGGGRLTVVASEQLGQAVVLSDDLPPAGATRVYQLWLVDPDGHARSADVLIGSSSSADLVSNVRPGDSVAITREPAGGSEQPTMTPLAVTKQL